MQLDNNKRRHYLLLFLIFLITILTITALLIQFISSAINFVIINSTVENPNNLWVASGPWANIWTSLSTFTIQSNILVLIFFILILVNYLTKRKIKWINSYFNLAITIYITITMLIFWATLFKSLLKTTNFQSTFDLIHFVNTFLLHLIIPLLTIIFYLLTAGKQKWTIKTTLTKSLPITISYLFIYLTYILIKGTFVGQIKIRENSTFVVDYSYPYFFLNIKTNLGTFFLYFTIILFLFLLLFACYYFYNNLKYQKNYNQNLTTKKNLFKAILD